MKLFLSILLLIVSQSIWWYLLHSILLSMNADRLLWFLFYAYIPVGIVSIGISAALSFDRQAKSK